MFHCSHPNAFFQPHLHPRGCSGVFLLGLGFQGCSGACSTPFSRLLQPSVRGVVDLGSWRSVITLSHLLSLWTCHTFSWGPFRLCSCRGVRETVGLLRSQGSVHSSAGSSCFLSLSSLLVPWHGLPVTGSVLWPLHGSAGLPLGHGSCFSYTPFSGYPCASIPRHMAGPVFGIVIHPRSSNSHTFPGSARVCGSSSFPPLSGLLHRWIASLGGNLQPPYLCHAPSLPRACGCRF